MTAFNLLDISLDIVYSWIRMLSALALSIVFSLAVGILAARNKKAESILVPLLDIFQSIPILGFFPIIVLGIIAALPSQIGVNLAVIVLIFTSMSWNIAFGVYEAVKSIPKDYIDLAHVSRSTSWQRIRTLYIPASLSRVAYNTQISWANGLFFLISSEIITLGDKSYTVSHGIGAAIMQFWLTQDYAGYAYSIIALIATVIVWQFAFLREFALWSERYKLVEEPRGIREDILMKFYSWVNSRSISKLFLLTHGRGITRFSSSLYRFRNGIKYSVLILSAIFVALGLSALTNSTVAEAHPLPDVSTIFSTEGPVLSAFAFSFLRVWSVYLVSVAIGLPLGIVIALNTKLYQGIVPLIEVIASVPPPALLPLISLFSFGQGEAVAAIVIFLGMIYYIIFNVMAGIRSLPSELWELKTAFKVRTLQAWRDIYLPATMTALVTGSITAIGASWNALIIAEYFNVAGGAPLTQVGTGIGKTIAVATTQGDLLTLTLAIISMTTLIVTFNLTVWRRVYHNITKRYTYNR